MSKDNITAVIAIVAEVLEIPEDELASDSSMDNVPMWDSLEHMNICLTFGRKFGVSLYMDDIASATSIQALAALIPQSPRERSID